MSKKNKRKRLSKPRLIMIAEVLFLILSLILFIKFDTKGAAEFTDNILRPTFGNTTVVLAEKVFFNSSDKITQLTGWSPVKAPEFDNHDKAASPSDGDLNLNSIPVNNKFTPLKNEGVWLDKPFAQFPNKQVVAYTFVRPDVTRQYAIVTLVQIDTGPILLGVTAGQKQPGGPVGNSGPGIIPQDIIDNGKLLAAFNGGFQYRDGMYGMIVGDKTYLPLQNDLATLVGHKNGMLNIIKYEGQDLGRDVIFVRQNCPMLVENGEVTVDSPQNHSLWGRTLTSDIYTWRSGIGITKNGNLIYAIGNNINPETLATALKMGGAISAMQLDINPYWVRFTVFDYVSNGKYNSASLIKDVYNGAKEFLNGYEKDFFYLYEK
jgi:hypothetical protein